MIAKPLNTCKVHVLVIILLVLLCNCLLQASVLLRWLDCKCSATASLVTESTLQVVQSYRVRYIISTYTHTHTHAHTRTHTLTHVHAHTNTNASKHTHVHTHTHRHTRTHAHTRTHTHKRTHAHTHTCTHTHTHTGSQSSTCKSVMPLFIKS